MKKFKLVLKSLVSNDACIEGGRKNPWWIGIIMVFLAMILAVIPVFTQTITKKGSEFIISGSDGFEVGAQRFIEDINDKGLILEIKEQNGDKYLSLDQATWNNAYGEEHIDARGYAGYQHLDEYGRVDFEAFFVSTITNGDISNILTNVMSEEGVFVSRTSNVLILGQKEFYAARYVNNTATRKANTGGDYRNFLPGFRINNMDLVTINGEAYDHNTITPDLYGAYTAGLWANWVYFFNQSYLYTRGQLTWQTTLLMFGINAGITLFMGLMIFVLTRGKYNPFKIYTIFDCLLIACWCSLAPAILTVGLGFLIKSFAQVIYPLLLGVRVMWLSMKSLRPDYGSEPQGSQKQVKTVDVKPTKK